VSAARAATVRRRADEPRAGGGEEHEQRRRSRSARARESGGHGVTARPPGPRLRVRRARPRDGVVEWRADGTAREARSDSTHRRADETRARTAAKTPCTCTGPGGHGGTARPLARVTPLVSLCFVEHQPSVACGSSARSERFYGLIPILVRRSIRTTPSLPEFVGKGSDVLFSKNRC
jgi:hypothetical protein